MKLIMIRFISEVIVPLGSTDGLVLGSDVRFKLHLTESGLIGSTTRVGDGETLDSDEGIKLSSSDGSFDF